MACGGVALSLMYEEFKILQWDGVGLDPICGDFIILPVISETQWISGVSILSFSPVWNAVCGRYLSRARDMFFLNCLWQHISLFHALFLTLLRLEEGNIFAFFMPCSSLSDALSKETYFPFSCS